MRNRPNKAPIWLILLCAFSVLATRPVLAQSETAAGLDQHVLALAGQLRCLVCQNQTLADSHAALAVDLRNQIRLQLQQGKTDQDILDFMAQRYGDFVLYRPPVRSATWILWFGPFLVLLFGLLFLFRHVRKNQEQTLSDPS